jgi:hypothetical protein
MDAIDQIANANTPIRENRMYQGPDGDNPFEKVEMSVKIMKQSEALKD